MEEFGYNTDPSQGVHILLESIINPKSSSNQKQIDKQILNDLEETSFLTENILSIIRQVPKLPKSMPRFPVDLSMINSQLDQINSQLKEISSSLNDLKQSS
ncbi:hypothetical protein SteCoe_2993 [Stentor coeruleus]|uniref:Uncharacterized protein n=1 Tax=Stentor coeruleus TaxID=5963 RepID=A0A1R2CY58_9CILI|nr:hypothetical protein SteCoe_2993 [Stentor coeruleus]